MALEVAQSLQRAYPRKNRGLKWGHPVLAWRVSVRAQAGAVKLKGIDNLCSPFKGAAWFSDRDPETLTGECQRDYMDLSLALLSPVIFPPS